MEKAKKAFKWFCKNWISVLICTSLAGACSITFINVIVRYFFKSFVIIGGEELTTLFICWTVFIGAAEAYRVKLMFGIDVFLKMMKPKMRNVVGIIIDIIVLVTAGYTSYLGFRLANSAWIRTTANLRIPYFFVDIPICIGFAMIFYYDLKDLLLRLFKIIKKDHPEEA